MKLLHLDDHTLFVEGLSVVISKHSSDITMLSATSVEAAWLMLEQYPDIELILIDLNMPEIDGLVFIEALNEKALYIPFIVLSASDDLFQLRTALNSGASGFIPKTHSSVQILEAITQVMAGNSSVSAEIERAIDALPELEPEHDYHKIMIRYKLGKRQYAVLKEMQSGLSNDGIAEALHLSKNTVKTHVRTLFTAFQVNNRLECVRYAEQIGLI